MRKIALVLGTWIIVSALPATAMAAPASGGPAPAASSGVSTLSHLPTCTPQSAVDRMVTYIRTQQQPDGSFPSIGQTSTADAIYALVASGVNPSLVKNNGLSAIDWIYTQTGNIPDAGTAAKFLLALILAGRSTTAPNGFDFVARVADSFNPATGLYDTNPTGNGYALIALRAAGRTVPASALSAWAALQQADGGWSFSLPPSVTDTNTTAVAVVALVANGRFGPIPAALAYLRTQQSADGGFTFSTAFGTDSDANSTGLVIIALLATGQDLSTWEKSGVDPVERLLRFQNASGAFRFSDAFPDDNAFATFQAGQAAGLTRCH